MSVKVHSRIRGNNFISFDGHLSVVLIPFKASIFLEFFVDTTPDIHPLLTAYNCLFRNALGN
jgi:hypothetical protein